MSSGSGQRHDRVEAGLVADHAGDVAPAGEVLGQDHVAGAHTRLGAVAHLDLGGARERDRVLPAWCAVPVEHVARRGHAEGDAGCRLHRAPLAVGALVVLERLHVERHLLEMRLSVLGAVDAPDGRHHISQSSYQVASAPMPSRATVTSSRYGRRCLVTMSSPRRTAGSRSFTGVTASPTPQRSEPPPLRVHVIPWWPNGISAVRAVELSCTITPSRGRVSARCAPSTAGWMIASSECSRTSFSSRSIKVLANARTSARCRDQPSAPGRFFTASHSAASVPRVSHCAARSSG